MPDVTPESRYGAGPDSDPYAVAEREAIQAYEREEERIWRALRGLPGRSRVDP